MRVTEEEKETARVEAFSDGVFAIAITLLVLELKVPHELSRPPALLQALLHQWPSYLAFLVSFVTILIMWVNHHRLFTLIRKSDERLLIFNGLLLLVITIVPFPTALLAEYFQTENGRTVALLYSAHGFNIALAYTLLWRHATGRGGRLLGRQVNLQRVEAITRQYRFGPLLYLVSFGLAFVSVAASVALNAGLAVFFGRPPPQLRLESPPISTEE
jgi:uncharacterized membrane protein